MIADDALRELCERVDGEVCVDAGTRAAYATDASNFRQVPLAVVMPHTVDAAAAAGWMARLSETPVGRGDLEAFFVWRGDPENRAAWDALAAGRGHADRYVVRPQADRFRVVDIWSGETAVIAMTPQDGLSEADARHTAQLLNFHAAMGLQ